MWGGMNRLKGVRNRCDDARRFGRSTIGRTGRHAGESSGRRNRRSPNENRHPAKRLPWRRIGIRPRFAGRVPPLPDPTLPACRPGRSSRTPPRGGPLFPVGRYPVPIQCCWASAPSAGLCVTLPPTAVKLASLSRANGHRLRSGCRGGETAMRVPRDLLSQKLEALKLVLPALFADALPEHHEAEFEKLSQDLLEQCRAEDRAFALAELAGIRRQMGLPVRDGSDGPA